ncbi:CotH kinase family protein, partial [bacterium]|nr:CotH kinase family protein [bacterium]
MVLCVILCAILPSLAMAALTTPTHPLFDGDAVHEIHLTFHQTSWYDSLVSNFEGLEEPLYLAAEFEWETIHFDSIGVRFKGNSSYYSYPSDKKSFKLDINAFVDGQEIYGLDKLNLNNGFLDPSFVREKCCYELCKAAGLPTERTNFAALYINEIYWGLYTIVEQYDQEFIESRFGNSEEGNLWKGDEHGTLEYLGPNQELYYSEYELKTNEEENDWSALIELVDKLNNTPLVDLSDTLHNLMDVNSALALLAVDNLTVNLDSYTGRCCNYYCYHRDLDNRFVFANWDVNESWGIFSMGMSVAQLKQLSPFWTINRPGENRPLAERLWQVDAYEAIYLGHMKKLMAIAAQPDWLLTRMEDLRDIIRPYVLADTKKMFSNAQFEAAMTSDINAGGPPPGRIIPGLESFMRERDTYLRNLIGTWTPIEGLVLNEVMARNNATLADEYGDYDDWIEITNVSTFSINLNGLGLNDHMDGTQSYIFPDTTLAPGAYLLVWADEEPEQGAFHAPFKLDGDGEDVYLIDGAVVIEQMTFPALDTDVSWGRWPDGTGEWQLLSEATPGEENQNPVEPEEIVLFINEFLALNEGVNTDETGAYEDWVEIYNPGP